MLTNGEKETVSEVGELEGQCAKDDSNCLGLLEVSKLTKTDTVFILLHGNAKNRGASHRIAAYKIFQSLGYYTLTMDYRGYGDSTMSYHLNETTVVEDAMAGIAMIRKSVGPDAKLILYGHSLGTGISAHAAALCMRDPDMMGRVDGIILDSPFHSLGALLHSGKIASVIDYIFDLEDLFRVGADIWFDTPGWLSSLAIPVRVFHAVVDPVTPLAGAKQIVEDVKKSGKENIDIHIWEEEGLGHIGISKTKTFKQEIKDFTDMVHLHK